MSIPYIPLYVADYEADTAHLSIEECGCGKVRYVPPSELREILARPGPYRCKSCAAVGREARKGAA